MIRRRHNRRQAASAALLALLTLTACDGKQAETMETKSMGEAQASDGPPVARIDNIVDTHWGVEVDDPYRYMEDIEDPYVREWFEGQAAFAEDYLGALPARDEIFERLKELDQGAPFTTSSVKAFPSGDVFYLRRDAGENLAKLYVHAAGADAPRVLVDPEALSGEGDEHVSLELYQPSWDARYVVYGLAQGGSEETTYHIIEVATGEAVDAPIGNIETAYNVPQWTEAGDGFYYSRRRDLPEDAPVTEIYKETAVRFHRLGTDPKDDPVIAAYGHSGRLELLDTDFPSIVISPTSPYAVLQVKHGDNREISLFSAPRSSLLAGDVLWSRISREADQITDFAIFGDDVYLMSGKNAPRFKLLKTSLAEPDLASAEVVIAPGETVLDGLTAARDALYINTMVDGVGAVLRLTPGDEPERLEVPRGGAAYVSAVSPLLAGVRVYESSWIQGGVRYRYDPESGAFSDDGLVPGGKFDNMQGFVAREVLVTSHDGTKVPLSILHRADIELDGSNPTIVYGYGSYGISMGVGFSTIRMAWVERGGVFAIAHVRGGGEYGQEWHYAGRMENKPNTWLDLIASAEYLAKEGYSSPQHMAPMGGSAGGILVGRSITTRPDLFGAAVIQVGMLDAIRAETTTNGVPNIKEFGTVTEKAGFEGLLAMSAYHQVEDDVSYPATLLTHGFNDPRVNPWMSGKMAARLQAVNQGDPPVLLRIDFDSGHGIGSTREQVLAQYADIYAFLEEQLRNRGTKGG
ncbi:MAG: prolyl oligopeptidase family serine peptidase [Halieaceae bacterium]|nr:prolyl oligopeptidase family serine peptidase [Halieaceae bacterium]